MRLVSAGFDGWQHDPLGGWQLGEQVFGWLGVELGSLAATVCDGRLLTVFEGGYSLAGLKLLTARYLRGVDLGVSGGTV